MAFAWLLHLAIQSLNLSHIWMLWRMLDDTQVSFFLFFFFLSKFALRHGLLSTFDFSFCRFKRLDSKLCSLFILGSKVIPNYFKPWMSIICLMLSIGWQENSRPCERVLAHNHYQKKCGFGTWFFSSFFFQFCFPNF